MPTIRVLIADDHPLMRAGLAASIDAEEDMEVVACAQNGEEALTLFRQELPDICLIDLRMPVMDGLSLIKAIQLEQHKTQIIVLTASSGDAHVERALRAGASSFLLKHMLRSHLIETIRASHRGVRILADEIANLLATNKISEAITAREIEVLSRVAKGRSNREIGKELSISEYTVKGHIKAIMTKLSANDRTHAVTIAIQRGFIDL